jgi:hypothetical protein
MPFAIAASIGTTSLVTSLITEEMKFQIPRFHDYSSKLPSLTVSFLLP